MGLIDRLRYFRDHLNPARARRELEREIDAHLELEIEEKQRAGLAAEQAEREARREFGNLLRTQERSRDASGFRPLDELREDVRFALRAAAKSPAATGVAVLTLGFSIGLCTAAFSLVDCYVLRPLPFPSPESIMRVRTLPAGAPDHLRRTVPMGLYRIEWPLEDAIVKKSVTWDLDAFTVVGDGAAEVLRGAWVVPAYFELTGAKAVLGRVFSEEEGQAGAAPVAVLSYEVWQRRYGGSPDVLGTSISVFTSDRTDEAESFTIVGVLSPDFWFFNAYTEIFTNLTDPRVPYLVRLQEGVEPSRAARHLDEIAFSQLDGIDPEWPGFQVVPAHEDYVTDVRRTLVLLSLAVGLVLLVACANVALLLTVRALARRPEVMVRRALGATGGRLARQLVTEGMLLSLAGGGLGCLMAWWGVGSLSLMIESQLRLPVPGGPSSITLDAGALGLALALGVLTGLLFTLAPLAAASGQRLSVGAAEAGRTGSGGSGAAWSRRAVIGAEVAVSLVLLVAAALMIQSTSYLTRVDVGFQPDDVLTASLSLRARDYREQEQLMSLVDGLLASLRATPGVLAASMTAGWPFQDRHTGGVLAAGGLEGEAPDAATYVVGDAYFETMQIPLRAGRTFESREPAPVVVISEALARRLWPGGDPIGRRLRLEVEGEGAPERAIVGVVGDVRETLIGEILPDTYIPLAQSPSVFLFVMARLGVGPEAVLPVLRAILADLDPTGAVTGVVPMTELIDRQRVRPLFLARLLGGFGAFALALTFVGIYSIIACAVARQRRDVAIHMAMGARAGSVVGLFLQQAAWTVLAGVAAGLLGSFALARLLESQLHGVTALDVPAWTAAVALLAAAALAAVAVPALRATAIDPARVLRED